jgi:hypothetical protein
MPMRLILSAAIALAAAFVCAPTPAHAQDCSTTLGQRLCANPDLTALEQERYTLQGDLVAANPEHALIADEQSWLAGQEACPDDACLRAGLLDRNQSLRLAIAAQSTTEEPAALEELPSIELPTIRPDRDAEAADGPREINPDPPFRWQDYIGALIAFALSLLIANWLWAKAARARRGDNG